MKEYAHDDWLKALLDRQIPQTAIWEGLRLDAYLCPAGYLTVGYGHNCESTPIPEVARVGDRVTKERAFALLREDAYETVRLLDRWLLWWRELSQPRAAVLFDMCFNMGIGFPPHGGKKGRGLRSFTVSLPLIREGHYERAACEMMRSGWASQVGDGVGGYLDRAEILAKQMETGQWQY